MFWICGQNSIGNPAVFQLLLSSACTASVLSLLLALPCSEEAGMPRRREGTQQGGGPKPTEAISVTLRVLPSPQHHPQEGCHRSLWRNRSARSAVNRKAGGSSPPRDVGAHFPAGGDMSPWCLASWLIHSIMAPTLEGEDSSLFACLPTLMDCGTLLDCVWRLLFMSL